MWWFDTEKKYWKKCPNPIYLVLEIVCTHNPGVVFTATPGLRDFIFLYELVQATWRYLRFIAHKKKQKKKADSADKSTTGRTSCVYAQLRSCVYRYAWSTVFLSSYYELVQTKWRYLCCIAHKKKTKKPILRTNPRLEEPLPPIFVRFEISP